MSTLKLLFVFLFLAGGAQAEGKERDGRQDTNVNSTVDALTAWLSRLEANEKANRRETLSLKQQLQQVNGQLQQVKGDNFHLSQQLVQVKRDKLHLSQQLQQVKGDNLHLSQQLQQVKGDNLHLSQKLQRVKGDNRRQTHLLNQYSAHTGNFTQHLQSVDYELDQYRSKLKHLSTTKSLQRASRRVRSKFAFHSELHNDTLLQPNERIRFLAGCVNTQRIYDNFSGFFTTPLHGAYFFIVNLSMNLAGPSGDVMLESDANCMATIFVTNSEYFTMGTAHLVINLRKSQRVWVKNLGPNQVLWPKSVFSGFLVHLTYRYEL